MLFNGARSFAAPPICMCNWRLLDARAATLDENHQHDDKQNTCDDPNNCGTFHNEFLPPEDFERASQAADERRAIPAGGREIRGSVDCQTGQREPQGFCCTSESKCATQTRGQTA